ncbi:unnamed protein product [Pedinophyceae sp. YPF-701]|nr:unnamed protein product [Pedinophyceae sp. YPF-701]
MKEQRPSVGSRRASLPTRRSSTETSSFSRPTVVVKTHESAIWELLQRVVVEVRMHGFSRLLLADEACIFLLRLTQGITGALVLQLQHVQGSDAANRGAATAAPWTANADLVNLPEALGAAAAFRALPTATVLAGLFTLLPLFARSLFPGHLTAARDVAAWSKRAGALSTQATLLTAVLFLASAHRPGWTIVGLLTALCCALICAAEVAIWTTFGVHPTATVNPGANAVHTLLDSPIAKVYGAVGLPWATAALFEVALNGGHLLRLATHVVGALLCLAGTATTHELLTSLCGTDRQSRRKLRPSQTGGGGGRDDSSADLYSPVSAASPGPATSRECLRTMSRGNLMVAPALPSPLQAYMQRHLCVHVSEGVACVALLSCSALLLVAAAASSIAATAAGSTTVQMPTAVLVLFLATLLPGLHMASRLMSDTRDKVLCNIMPRHVMDELLAQAAAAPLQRHLGEVGLDASLPSPGHGFRRFTSNWDVGASRMSSNFEGSNPSGPPQGPLSSTGKVLSALGSLAADARLRRTSIGLDRPASMSTQRSTGLSRAESARRGAGFLRSSLDGAPHFPSPRDAWGARPRQSSEIIERVSAQDLSAAHSEAAESSSSRRAPGRSPGSAPPRRPPRLRLDSKCTGLRPRPIPEDQSYKSPLPQALFGGTNGVLLLSNAASGHQECAARPTTGLLAEQENDTAQMVRGVERISEERLGRLSESPTGPTRAGTHAGQLVASVTEVDNSFSTPASSTKQPRSISSTILGALRSIASPRAKKRPSPFRRMSTRARSTEIVPTPGDERPNVEAGQGQDGHCRLRQLARTSEPSRLAEDSPREQIETALADSRGATRTTGGLSPSHARKDSTSKDHAANDARDFLLNQDLNAEGGEACEEVVRTWYRQLQHELESSDHDVLLDSHDERVTQRPDTVRWLSDRTVLLSETVNSRGLRTSDATTAEVWRVTADDVDPQDQDALVQFEHMPRYVRGPERPLCYMEFQDTTVVFSDIVGYTQMSSSLHPGDVLATLNKYFERLDQMVRVLGVYKYETVGDAYVAVINMEQSGGDSGDRANAMMDHALTAFSFAESIFHAAATVLVPGGNGAHLRARVGIHTGPLAGAVLGDVRTLFTLVGDTLNTASRMESASEAGCIKMSHATWSLLPPEIQTCCEHQREHIKGKGVMDTYLARVMPASATPSQSELIDPKSVQQPEVARASGGDATPVQLKARSDSLKFLKDDGLPPVSPQKPAGRVHPLAGQQSFRRRHSTEVAPCTPTVKDQALLSSVGYQSPVTLDSGRGRDSSGSNPFVIRGRLARGKTTLKEQLEKQVSQRSNSAVSGALVRLMQREKAGQSNLATP